MKNCFLVVILGGLVVKMGDLDVILRGLVVKIISLVEGSEVVVGQHHVGRFLADLRSGNSHGYADVGGL